ncbi:hypothetical protein STSP_02430 [Streptomyces jeddahensis]|uniref:Uncharacterized protein n=1 Tax=Streptomyces jeddahensis TaxID=1716141 RepID=A0A177I1V7_9ACTN|nr:hypothetical protein STSP_02430 [Streptomyces jeddahensis]
MLPARRSRISARRVKCPLSRYSRYNLLVLRWGC